jgi:hypothetical protein
MKMALGFLILHIASCVLIAQAPNLDANLRWKRPVLDGTEHGPKITRPSNQFASIVFVDNQRIAVAEEVPTGNLSSRTSVSRSSAFALKLQVLNASTGSATQSFSWPTRRSESLVQAVAGGLLVRSGGVLRFYDSQMKAVSEFPLPENSDEKWAVMVSNSQQTVVLRHYDSTHNQFMLLDEANWQVKRKWDSPPAWPPIQLPYSASDEALARIDSEERTILYSKFGDWGWRAIGTPSRLGCSGTPAWINTVSLVNIGCDLAVISVGGEVLMRFAPPKNWTFQDRVAISHSGRYLAARQDTGKGGGFFDRDVTWTASRIVVYDLSAKSLVLSVSVVPRPRDTYDFALSPDGSKLGVLCDGVLSLYNVHMTE